MFIAAIICGVVALIGMIVLFLEGIITILSKNNYRRGLRCIGGAVLLGLFVVLMGLYILYVITPAQPS